MDQANQLLIRRCARDSSLSPALCVDLDGTLVKSDTLVDSLFTLFRRNPIQALRCWFFMARGKAAFKAEIAQHVNLNPAVLPYNRPLLEYLRGEHAAGRDIFLATATNEVQAKRIADHLGMFAGVLASNTEVNLRDQAKREALERQFPDRGFDYVGNARRDLPALGGAQKAMLANPDVGLREELKRKKIAVHEVFEDRSPRIGTIISAIRVKQWPKNLLIFLPLALAHSLFHRHLFLLTVIAFCSWSFAASATYVLNDLLDIEADRAHPAKRKRPFASGDFSARTGAFVVCLLVLLAVLLASRLPARFAFWLAAYFVTTIAYSVGLKKVALIDVITLAGLYTVRMVAGASATDVEFSAWLGGFSIFFFLSLALAKRYAELDNMRRSDRIPANGRGYRVEDIDQLRSFGTASGYAAVVVFTLYINNPEILQHYLHFQRLWLLAPVLIFWINRIWLLAHRGELDEDPVVFTLTDYWSAALAVVALLIIFISI
jgi:4-hydroxybenzoate polyprenyltransferase/phosphoserine phosphatase